VPDVDAQNTEGVAVSNTSGESRMIPLADGSMLLGQSGNQWKEVWSVDTSINADSLYLRDDESGYLYHVGMTVDEGLYYEKILIQDLEQAGIYNISSGNLRVDKQLADITRWRHLNPTKIDRTNIDDIKETADAAKMQAQAALLIMFGSWGGIVFYIKFKNKQPSLSITNRRLYFNLHAGG
jgi:hypothetical protein